MIVSCYSDHTREDLKDNNNTAKLSNFFWSATLTHAQKSLEVKMLKEVALL